MSHASLDRFLAILIGAAALTGLLAIRSGTIGWAWVFVLHGLVSITLLWAVVFKLRRSLPRAVAARRWGRAGLGLLVGVIALLSLLGGVAWVASARLLTIGSWTVLSLHALAGLVLVPLVLVHLLPRRWRLLRPGRHALAAAGQRLMSRLTFMTNVFLGLAVLTTYGGEIGRAHV